MALLHKGDRGTYPLHIGMLVVPRCCVCLVMLCELRAGCVLSGAATRWAAKPALEPDVWLRRCGLSRSKQNEPTSGNSGSSWRAHNTQQQGQGRHIADISPPHSHHVVRRHPATDGSRIARQSHRQERHEADADQASQCQQSRLSASCTECTECVRFPVSSRVNPSARHSSVCVSQRERLHRARIAGCRTAAVQPRRHHSSTVSIGSSLSSSLGISISSTHT